MTDGVEGGHLSVQRQGLVRGGRVYVSDSVEGGHLSGHNSPILAKFLKISACMMQ